MGQEDASGLLILAIIVFFGTFVVVPALVASVIAIFYKFLVRKTSLSIILILWGIIFIITACVLQLYLSVNSPETKQIIYKIST